ncbi:hypothetical protein PLICRDRAFT_591166 [Plicaturopsis crispa FD-325 SS-3]|nr:hypothetical protein PLICRDRAFT_591166 [Plicaturopsis crispa FD-325 SS-3]
MTCIMPSATCRQLIVSRSSCAFTVMDSCWSSGLHPRGFHLGMSAPGGWISSTQRSSMASLIYRVASSHHFQSMAAPENVGIFWDFENVSHQCSRLTGYALANNIRDLAFDYGRVNVFKAYLEIVANSPKAATFRSQLQCSGVSLTDCPHNDRKEVADNMMIVDLFAYAIQNPPPATIVLITGDRDFAYAISVLRMLRYNVVLILPPTPVHESLPMQASCCFNWVCDVLERGNQSQASNMAPRTTLSKVISPPVGTPLISAPQELSPPAVASRPLSALNGAAVIDEPRTRIDAACQTTGDVGPVGYAPSVYSGASEDGHSEKEDVAQPELPSARACTDVQDSSSVAQDSQTTDTSTSGVPSSDVQDTAIKTPVHPADSSALEDAEVVPRKRQVPLADVPSGVSASKDGDEAAVDAENVPFPSMPAFSDFRKARSEPAAAHPFISLSPFRAAVPSPFPVLWRPTSPRTSQYSFSNESSISVEPSTNFTTIDISDSSSSTVFSLDEEPQSIPFHLHSTKTGTFLPDSSSFLSVDTPAQDPEVAKRFRALINALTVLLSEGVPEPSSSAVRHKVEGSGEVSYGSAGVESFEDYVAQATLAGVVHRGGFGESWIALMPSWRHCDTTRDSTAFKDSSSSGKPPPSPPPTLQATSESRLNSTLGDAVPLGNVASAVEGANSPKTYATAASGAFVATPAAATISTHAALPFAAEEISDLAVPAEQIASAAASRTIQVVPRPAAQKTAICTGDPCVNREVPLEYRLLMEILIRMRSNGVAEPFQLLVAEELQRRDPSLNVYADVKTFVEYAASADKLGLVVLGTNNGTPSITLHPRWRNCAHLAKAPAATVPIVNPPPAPKSMQAKPASSPLPSSSTPASIKSSSAKAPPSHASTSGTAPVPAKSRSATPPVRVVPPAFVPLVRHLQLCRSKNVFRPERSQVAAEVLKQNKNAYKDAGVSKWKQYADLAAAVGIVELGGRGGGNWIALHPDWYYAASM